MKQSYRKLLFIFFSFLLTHAACAAICTLEAAESADAMVDKINNWNKVNYTFKKFQQCDDGSIAEGNAEAIARLLVDKWNTLPLLARLIKQNPSLKQFVLNHINTTLDTDDLEKIKKLSSTACPKNLSLLCQDLNNAAKNAI